MKIEILPKIPRIFIGQSFSLQLQISDCDAQVRYIVVQVVGKTIVNDPEVHPFLQETVKSALKIVHNAPFFGHVITGSTFISNRFENTKTFSLTILADKIPPSYNGKGVSIVYNLVIGYVGYHSSNPEAGSFRIVLVAPHKSEELLHNTQDVATFSIKVQETNTFESPMMVNNPLAIRSNFRTESFKIQGPSGVIAEIQTPLSTLVGQVISGVINLEESNQKIIKAHIKIVRNEIYAQNKKVYNIIENELVIKLLNTIKKQFKIQVPLTVTANFTTDLITIEYDLEFDLKTDKNVYSWKAPIKIYPPEFLTHNEQLPIC